jgi:hypothetical protein
MPPISPCGLVVDYVRSCFAGQWRFFPSRPDVLTPGYFYFTAADVPTIAGPHPFGSAGWNKDGMIYPPQEVGQQAWAGQLWYDGKPPDPVPPDQQIFPTQDFASDFDPLIKPPATVNGFDARCYVIVHPGVDFDVDSLFRPDVTDCCWQRVLCALLALLDTDQAADLVKFRAACLALWGADFTVVISSETEPKERFALIAGPKFQVVLRVGTQDWAELFEQCFHSILSPRNYGTFGTSPVWFDESTTMLSSLDVVGWDPNLPTTFVGYSKGGCVCWIAARRMMEARATRSIDVLTIACPKAGDARLVENDGLRETRHIAHRQDIIPLVPPPRIMQPLLDSVTSIVNLERLAVWQNFSVYQITGDGWGNGVEPADVLSWQTYAEYLALVLTARAPRPIQQHQLSSYIAGLADCCSAPKFPFSSDLWELLFGVPDNAFGGLMIGDNAELTAIETTGGLIFGGGSMPFPDFVVPISIWRFSNWNSTIPPVNPADVTDVAYLTPGKKVFGEALNPMSFLLVPKTVDIRFSEDGVWTIWPPTNPDLVEVPTGSGKFYIVFDVERAELGFLNEHQAIGIVKQSPWSASPPPSGNILLEDGTDVLLEDGTLILLE